MTPSATTTCVQDRWSKSPLSPFLPNPSGTKRCVVDIVGVLAISKAEQKPVCSALKRRYFPTISKTYRFVPLGFGKNGERGDFDHRKLGGMGVSRDNAWGRSCRTRPPNVVICLAGARLCRPYHPFQAGWAPAETPDGRSIAPAAARSSGGADRRLRGKETPWGGP